jgi:predicted ArsR family transcriptional regulator
MDESSDFTDTLVTPGADEEPPDFSTLDSPTAVLTDHPIRERLFDVLLQLRDPTKVSVIAERADCDTETARDYLEWFAAMGMVREYEGRPTRYQRNDAYLQWRRIEHLRAIYSDDELVAELQDVLEEIAEYRDQFDADTPEEVSLVEASQQRPTEEAWEALSAWRTLQRRAELLDLARREDRDAGGRVGRADV